MIVSFEEQLWMAAVIAVGVLYAILAAAFKKRKG
jgi:hypothetical protein